MANNNVMKAMYPISLEKNGKTDQERNIVNVNQERLNDNFRSIAAALSSLFQSGEHTLKYLTARIKDSEEMYEATLSGVDEKVRENSAEILALPTAIMQMVGSSILNYNADGNPVEQSVNTVITQQNNAIDLKFTQVDDELGTIQSWVRIYGPTAASELGISPGVIIGDNLQPYALKAEGNAIYFFRGADNAAKKANMLAGFDASGNFEAGAIHNESSLIDGKFDVDVVNANGVDFLHITGRN